MNKYLYWLDRVEGLGPISKRNLIEAFGSAEEVYKASELHLKYIMEEKKLRILLKAKETVDLETLYEKLVRDNIFMCCYHESEYPEKLKNIPDPPFCLYYKGRLPQIEIPSVAIIGARECSGYGEYIASELGKMLGMQGIQVISGMARGIDGISQSAALKAGGISFGVLGCGVDVCYPKSNQQLYDELLLRGGIISTYPPGTQPQAKLFPPRNRIVSGLSDVLVVIEARRRSGTSITVEMALEQGRDIYAVPGRVTDRLSDGCNKMLKEGAHVFLSPDDFLLELEALLPSQMECFRKQQLNGLTEKDEAVTPEKFKDEMGDKSEGITDEDNMSEKIYSVLDIYPKSIEVIMEQLHTAYQLEVKQEDLIGHMMLMCLVGNINQDSAGWFSRNTC